MAGEKGGLRIRPVGEKRHAEPVEIALADLMGTARELHIRHGDDVYTLRLTSNGKLLLTK